MKNLLVIVAAWCAAASLASPASKGKSATPSAVNAGRSAAATSSRASSSRSDERPTELNETISPLRGPKVESTTTTNDNTTVVSPDGDKTTSSSSSISETVKVTDVQAIGLLETRPTFTTNNGEVHTENTAELGLKTSPNFAVSWLQYFNTNMYTPSAVGSTKGLGLVGQDGYLRFRINKIWQNNGFSFNLEPRLGVPTDPAKRADGLIAFSRIYLSLKKEFSPAFALTLYDVPVPMSYQTAVSPVTGKSTPAGENRVYLVADWNITEKLTFSMPFMWVSTKYRDGGSVTAANPNSGKWTQFFYVWPELDYAINPTVTIGAAFESDNLISDNANRFTVSNGLRKGLAQMVLRASL